MPTIQLSPASVEPISVDEVKSHLRISHSNDDSYLAMLLAASRSHVEVTTHKRLITQSVRLLFDGVGKSGLLRLFVGPIQSVDQIVLINSDDSVSALDPAAYEVDIHSDPARLQFKTTPLPHKSFAGIGVDLTVGYGESGNDIPINLRHAILLLTGHLYDYREAATESGGVHTVPLGYEALIAPFRTTMLGAQL